MFVSYWSFKLVILLSPVFFVWLINYEINNHLHVCPSVPYGVFYVISIPSFHVLTVHYVLLNLVEFKKFVTQLP